MKGQVDAPIELVIAIIVLVMSMAIAFTVINQSETGKCMATLKMQTQQLQEAMLDVALGSAGSKKSTTFTMLRCGDKSVEALQFVQFKSPEFCRLCPGHYGGCWQIIPVARTRDGLVQLTDATTCVELPAEGVRLTSAGGEACSALQLDPCGGLKNCDYGEMGLPPSLRPTSGEQAAKAIWRTLGSDSSKTFLITFTKATAGGERIVGGGASETSEIRICAEPGSGRRSG